MYIDKFDNAKFCFEYSGIEIILQKHFALEVWFSNFNVALSLVFVIRESKKLSVR